MRNLTKTLAFALILVVSLYACDTKKTTTAPAPAPTGFTAAQVAGTWRLTSGSSLVAGGAITIPNIFDQTAANPAIGSPDGRGAFCTKNSVLTLDATGTFTEAFVAATYTFSGQPDQLCGASTLSGTFAIPVPAVTTPASPSVLTLTYAGGTPSPRPLTVKSVTATNMVIEISSNAGGVPSVTTVTYTKI